jgi:hypothetical protein
MRTRWFDQALDTLPAYPYTPLDVVVRGDTVSCIVTVRQPWGEKSFAVISLIERDGVPVGLRELLVVRDEA